MILKICKEEKRENQNSTEGTTKVITEFYNANSFTIKDGMAISDRDMIFVSDYKQIDEIDGSTVNYKIVYAFLMNNEGKTIEKLV